MAVSAQGEDVRPLSWLSGAGFLEQSTTCFSTHASWTFSGLLLPSGVPGGPLPLGSGSRAGAAPGFGSGSRAGAAPGLEPGRTRERRRLDWLAFTSSRAQATASRLSRGESTVSFSSLTVTDFLADRGRAGAATSVTAAGEAAAAIAVAAVDTTTPELTADAGMVGAVEDACSGGEGDDASSGCRLHLRGRLQMVSDTMYTVSAPVASVP